MTRITRKEGVRDILIEGRPMIRNQNPFIEEHMNRRTEKLPRIGRGAREKN